LVYYSKYLEAKIVQQYSAGLRDRCSGFESRKGFENFILTTASRVGLEPMHSTI